MIFIAVLRANGQTIATGNSAAEAYNAAVAAGHHPQDFQIVPITSGPRA